MVDSKRKRTLTETSCRSEDGAVLYKVNSAGNEALHSDKAKQVGLSFIQIIIVCGKNT